MHQYYTLSQANAALPEVKKKYEHLLQCRDRVMRAEQLIQAGMASGIGLGEYMARKRELNTMVTAFYGAIEALEGTGVAIKGINEGLLDFPSKRFDDEVWLCWKYGEAEIKFWHEKDSGFNDRKPLAVSDESLT